ncbi:hypothetical protein ABIQ69_13280 [Agromyces sp. G08B096]|uniref:Uncharacterized protein n=1 Tax=Agromyces sp. G08B096 TaxID=3156399 RepID=A0AAU7W7A8_9MICO
MYVTEQHFPWLRREYEAELARDLERRRVLAERIAEERDASDGRTDASRARGIRQLLPTRLAAWRRAHALPA